jgi:hypothetical protein
MTWLLPHVSDIPTTATGDWMHDRLTEARGILADLPQHPVSLVILAARVVAGQTVNARECADAIDILCELDRRPLHAIATAAFATGGAE